MTGRAVMLVDIAGAFEFSLNAERFIKLDAKPFKLFIGAILLPLGNEALLCVFVCV